MRKITLLLLLPLLMICSQAWGQDIVIVDGLQYELLNESNASVIIQEVSGNVVIPETFSYNEQTYTVTTIEDGAFECNDGLTSLTIPASVTSIGSGIVGSCIYLTSISVQSGNTVYDSRDSCNAIIETATNKLISGCQSTVIPSTVTSIGDYAFDGCEGLTSVVIPSSVSSIGNYAFQNCAYLTHIFLTWTAPSACTYGEDMLSNIPPEATVYVLAGTRDLYQNTEPWCNFNIEYIVTDGYITFDGLKYTIESTNYTAEVVKQDADAVLDDITIPETFSYFGNTYTVTSIAESAFYFCTGLTGITIPNAVTSIGNSAFANCTSLSSITIPSSVTSIGERVFALSPLTSISVQSGNTVYDSRNDCNAIIETATNKLIAGCHGTVIPSTVTSIGDYAFDGCTAIEAITIPSSVTSIGDYAFYGCTGLTSITIPDSVTSIGEQAFWACQALTSITIPSTVSSIGNSAFYGCSRIDTITLAWTDPSACTYGTGVLTNVPTTATVYVPQGTADAYSSNSTWGSFTNIEEYVTNGDIEVDGIKYTIESTNYTAAVAEQGSGAVSGDITIPETISYFGNTYTVTSIGASAFRNCSGLTSISISDSVTVLGNYAFAYCTGLTSITIPDAVKSIGDAAFNGCTGLTSITIPDSVTSIGDRAFSWCDDLAAITVASGNPVYDSRNNCNAIIETASNTLFAGCYKTVIPNSVTSIGDNAFYDCVELTSIDIPNSVTSIGDYAFCGCDSLTSITIPDSVTSIGDGAFCGCDGLASITIPDSVTSIGNGAFEDCKSLTSVNIPSSVSSIGYYAFYNCTGLDTITLNWTDPTACTYGDDMLLEVPTTATVYVPYGTSSDYLATEPWSSFTIEEYVTDGEYTVDGIKYNVETANHTASVAQQGFGAVSGDITIPETITIGSEGFAVTSIGNDAFYGCFGLTSISIPNSVTSIGDNAFMDCYGLESLTIPASVTSIGVLAFYQCSGLDTVTVENGNTVYDSRDNCNAIIETSSNTLIAGFIITDIPSTVTGIGDYAFAGCSGMTSIDIPNSVTSIGEEAFEGCSSLTSITIPNSVISIREGAFSHCVNLSSITVESGNSAYDSRDNCNAIIETATNKLIRGSKNTTIIPSTVTSIGNYAFDGYTELYSIDIPNSVTSIGVCAFEGCTGFASIDIPNSVTSIGECAFQQCTGLKSIIIPESIDTIRAGTFLNCENLISITIPASVKYIGDEAFMMMFEYDNCDSITLAWTDPSVCTYGTDVLTNIPTSATVYVPAGTRDLYQAIELWSRFTIEEYATDGDITVDGLKYTIESTNYTAAVAEQGGGAVSGDITIPETISYFGHTYTVTSLADHAFNDCDGLTSITIPNSVTSIGKWAFAYCYGLTSVTIPDAVKSIGYYAFAYCKGLTSITIPDAVTSIGDNAFVNCKKLTAIHIPASVTSIGTNPFSSCEALETITVDENNTVYNSGSNSNAIIETTGHKLITGCKNTVIPTTVTSIGNDAFAGCTGLTGITIPDSVNSIGSSAFADCTGLTSVTLPNAVKSIGNAAFTGCTGLSSITIPDSVNSIEYRTFYKCTGLKSVTIPKTVKSIGDYAFANCSAIDTITLAWTNPDSCSYGTDIFTNVPTTAKLYVPAGTKSLYAATSPWSEFSNIYSLPAAGFYRIKGGTSGMYLASGISDNGGLNMSSATDASTIFYYDGSHLTNYGSGRVNATTNNSFAWLIGESNASTVEVGYGQTTEDYSILSADVYLYDNGTASSNATASSTNDGTDANLNSWQFEEVTSLPFTISSAGQATLCLPVAYVVPTGVAVRYATRAHDNLLTVVECGTDVSSITAVPANTPVILKGEAGDYTLNLTTTDETLEGNVLTGTTQFGAAVSSSTDAYILALNGQNQVVFALLSGTDRNIAAFKAYFILDSGADAPQYLFFDDGDATVTGIDAVHTAIQQGLPVYDLQGRRVTNPTNGVYIVNGKKVMVK